MACWKDASGKPSASLTNPGRVGEIVYEKGYPKNFYGLNYAYSGGAYPKVVFGRG